MQELPGYGIAVEWDERGCWLVLKYEEIEARWPVDNPEALYDAVRAEIGPWLHERELARKTAPAALYVDDSGYDLSDPKHPEFHSIHADIHDLRGF